MPRSTFPISTVLLAVVSALLPVRSIQALATFSATRTNMPRNGATPLESTATGDQARQQPQRIRVGDYELILINIPAATSVQPYAINNHRIASGQYLDAVGNVHSFVWANGQVITIDRPDTPITSIASINDKGILFGNWGTDTEQHAGSYDLATGAWTALPDIPDHPLNTGSRMNDAGVADGLACAHGTFTYGGQDCEAWTWDGHHYTFYNYAPAVAIYPDGVNARGEEVGVWLNAEGWFEGFYRYRGNIATLEIQTSGGVVYPTAYEINNDGLILGFGNVGSAGEYVPILFRKQGGYHILPQFPGAQYTAYAGMNKRKDLVGSASNVANVPILAVIALRTEDEHCDQDGDSNKD